MPLSYKTKKLIRKALLIVCLAYIGICTVLFFFQEKFIYFPEKLNEQHTFRFTQPFEEKYFATKDGQRLHGLVFKSDSSKGLVFFLHGNAGSLNSWGSVAPTYTKFNYDIFIPDYRGYGKSEGKINSEEQLYEDFQLMYDSLKKIYPENKIVMAGYSIGTGPATYLAANNHPRLLLLHAPYYNLTAMLRRYYPIIPGFVLKYKFKTNELLQNCSMPIVIFHGDADKVIPYNSSLQLQKHFKNQDTLITLHHQGHNGITENQQYILALEKILSR